VSRCVLLNYTARRIVIPVELTTATNYPRLFASL